MPNIRACKESAKLQTLLAAARPAAMRENDPPRQIHGGPGISIADVQKLPGHRHDNDHMDFRKIQIVPTVAEAAAQEMSFTPLADETNKFLSDEHAHALDTQFRLLREDFLRPLKQELARTDRPKIFRNAFFLTAAVKPLSCVMVKVDVPAELAKADITKKTDFWEEDHNQLARGSLVCLVQHGRPKLFGRIVMRDTAVLAAENMIGLGFEGADLILALTQVNLRDTAFELVPVSSSFFSYEPILQCLQALPSFPFAKELVDVKKPAPVTYLDQSKVQRQLELLRRKTLQPDGSPIEFDTSQKAALDAALRDRVSLLQGPPGTGKTFIGTLLAQAILNASNVTILCVCYTNHALDQFLESLLERGVDEIVRLGGRTKNERIEPLQLRNLSEHHEQTKEQKKQWWLISSGLTELEEEFAKCVGFLEMDRLNWRRLSEHLASTEPDVLEQLRVPENRNGFELVGSGGKKITKSYLWDRWNKGKDSSPISRSGYLWSMNMKERNALMNGWLETLKREVADKCGKIMLQHQKLTTMKQAIRHEGDRQILAKARVIGCTTHGAATRKDLLIAAGAKVLIVEEAAEILEAHVITSIGADIEHIIQIGDHQQLRPKAECYDLTVEADKGCNLNTSMFERLVKKGFPYQTLTVQHRMRPEISKLIRDFPTGGYPSLVDAQSVSLQPKIRGVQRNVVFIHHENHEEEVQTMFKLDSFTRVNKYEVKMVVAIVNYLLQQGYELKQLVVLTPYGSQLKAIRQALSKLNLAVLIDDMDVEDLQKTGDADTDDVAAATVSQDAIRVATIDNYQGEEADVVVASLVRSNRENKIGHLQEPERVNVLLSRAKHGLILLGNAQTLIKARVRPGGAKDLWPKILKFLLADKCVLRGLPIVCQKHTQQCSLAGTPGAFANIAPNGGCNLSCGYMLPCGHECQLRCHSYDPAHTISVCHQPMIDHCEKGHIIQRPCYKAATEVLCQTCEIEAQEAQRRKKVEEQKQKEAIEEEKKRARIAAATEMSRLQSQPLKRHKTTLTRKGETAEEYHRIVDRVENYMQAEHGLLTVKRVEKLVNTELESQLLAAKQQMIDPTKPPTLLFHGTSAEVTDLVAEGGFNLPAWKESNMFGQGVYFATDSTKSANPLYTKNSNRLLVCEVLLGKSCTIEGWDHSFPLKKHMKKSGSGSNKGRNFLDVDLKKMHAAGFDSVYALRDSESAGGVKFDEFIVYDERLAVPRYIVYYERGCHLPSRTQKLAAGKRHVLKPVRNYDPNSAEQVLYRMAESQFLRMLANRGATSTISQIEYHVDPKLERAFEAKKREYDRDYGVGKHESRLVFHGTKSESIDSIMSGGFKLAKVGSATDAGWYGAGIYFSEQTAYSQVYDKAGGRLILCQLLLGKPCPLKHEQRCDGKGCKAGFTSHVVGDGAEVVMFDMAAILPTYIVHYT
eukprot:COSAG02_NODE_1623_length_11604_cov_27.111951_6_plen_1427_part_00